MGGNVFCFVCLLALRFQPLNSDDATASGWKPYGDCMDGLGIPFVVRLRAPPHEPLVGREEPLARLRAWADPGSVRQGQGRACVVTGTGGVGKSAQAFRQWERFAF